MNLSERLFAGMSLDNVLKQLDMHLGVVQCGNVTEALSTGIQELLSIVNEDLFDGFEAVDGECRRDNCDLLDPVACQFREDLSAIGLKPPEIYNCTSVTLPTN